VSRAPQLRSAAWRLVAGLLAIGLAPPAAAAEPPRTELDVQGHRGCRGLMPENSMPAFRHALELGVTTLELDVQSTGDRVLVVQHDAKLVAERCVGPDGRRVEPTPLRRLTWDQLQGIDCGRVGHRDFPEQELVSAPIPRLDEVLALAEEAGYPVRLSIEIKQQDAHGPSAEELAEPLVAALRRHGLVQRTIVQSFHAEALLAVRALEPALALAILVRNRGAYDRELERSGAGILSPKHRALRKEDVERMQRRGVAVIPWTVNRPDAIRRLIDWGVDGIISDYPDRVLAALREGGADGD
jgi:glycerophosphoryl diester phosphodiesterase